MKHWYISYTYIDGFGNRQHSHKSIESNSPIIWIKTLAPLGSVILFYSQISKEEYNSFNKL